MSGFDARSLILDGRRQLLLSGAVHYPRSTPQMWPEILRESKRAGLTCIDTYVFWEAHEPQEGRYDFSGRYDLGRFLDACQNEGLYVVLRIGPYVCAEWNFGGLPWWLITKKGLVTRTYSRPYLAAVRGWIHELARRFGDRQRSRGGPIVLVQMENEYDLVKKRYGKDGPRYLEWCESEARRAGWEVPQIMCVGASRRAIATLNGFDVGKKVPKLRRDRPRQPALWTEHWPGWYDTWGSAHHRRDASAIAFEALRFMAAGGTGINFYMWFGGTNFGRDSMFLQTTSYDFDAPLDEYAKITDKGRHLARLCSFLHGHDAFFLEGDRVENRPVAKDARGRCASVTFTLGEAKLELWINGTSSPKKVRSGSASLELPAQAAAAFELDGARARCVYRSWTVQRSRPARWTPAPRELVWDSKLETVPEDGDPRFEPASIPHNMLHVTRDETDYGWYRAEIDVAQACRKRLALRVGDRVSVWVNGAYQGTGPLRLGEVRLGPKSFETQMDIRLARGKNVLLFLVSALGMVKGDWMIGRPQSTEWKGLHGAWLDGKLVRSSFAFRAGPTDNGVASDDNAAPDADWQPVARKPPRLAWYRARFELPDASADDGASFAFEPGKLVKGMLWLNGRCVGRYWQLAADRSVPKQDRWLEPYVTLDAPGKPTQLRYHLPREWLRPGENTLIAFEEEGGSPLRSRIVQRRGLT